MNELLLLLTSPGCVQTLNNYAIEIMAQYNITVISSYDAIVNECGGVPVQSCFGEFQCFCPHCRSGCGSFDSSSGPPGYQWVVENALAPAVRTLLEE